MVPVRIGVLACRMDALEDLALHPVSTRPEQESDRRRPFAMRYGERRPVIVHAAVSPTAPERARPELNIPPTHPLTTACSWMRNLTDATPPSIAADERRC